MSAAAPSLLFDMDVEMTLDPQLEEEQQPVFIYMVINSLAASGDGPASPPIFREDLGPAPAHDHHLPESPASPDPYGDEGSSDAES